MKLEFPKDFYWGAATSSHQVEGNNHNDWSEWEKKNSERLAKEAAKKKWPDYILNPPAGGSNPLQKENYISGRACDHYNRFREDFDIAKSLGHNAHRFSIEWSRIEPEEGKFDEKEIKHYREVIKALRERGLEPFVTLWHWTLPIWVARQGGWENKKTIEYFLRYAEKIMHSSGIGDSVKFWVIVNEPNVYAGKGYIQGDFPPQVKSFWRADKVLKNLMNANNRAYSLMHKIAGDKIQIGSTHFLVAQLPYNPDSFLDKISVKFLDYIRNFMAFKKAKERHDFIGIDYYHLEKVEFSLKGRRWFLFNTHADPPITEFGWKIYPEGIYKFLIKLKKYNLPIFILENGIADARDEKRAKFIKEHLKWVHKAISEGVDVRGYFYWSLLDNFEWDKGFWPRFGLVEVDYKTMERKIRNSATEYAKICRDNAIDIEI